MSKIVIGVACHKPFEMPDNDLYLPIEVGAALRENHIPGTQPDDEGENISEKNPQYCELTAQYWLWKNVDADYYGLCHYRRFLSFSPTRFDNFTEDNRKQVLVPELDDASKKKYHLEDEAGMRAIIEAADIVAPDEQDLTKVYTPHGHKRSVYAHFAAHDHDLINVHDLDAMIAIVHEKYPQYAEDLDEYLKGAAFRGFNCFVMKRDLFHELCAYEFDVLSELERVINMDTYDTMRRRVYGFMAEIISSAFIYHVAKTGRAQITDVQMLYFDSTDPIVPLVPWKNSSAVVLNALVINPCMLSVELRSFVATMDPSRRYDLIIAHGEQFTEYYRKAYTAMMTEFDNIRITFIDWKVKSRALEDAVNARKVLGASLHCALPWLLPEYDRALVLEWNVLFNADWSALLSVDFEGNVVAAAPDVEWIGECNSVYSDTRKFVTHFLGLRDPFALASSAVVAMDLAAIRSLISLQDLIIVLGSFERELETAESFNVIFENSILPLDMRYNVRVSTVQGFALKMGDLPLEIGMQYRQAVKDPIITLYAPDDPFWGEADHIVAFWELARESPFYERILMQMMSEHVRAGKHGRDAKSIKQRVFEGVAPEGSRRRGLIRKILPWNSPAARTVRKIVDRF